MRKGTKARRRLDFVDLSSGASGSGLRVDPENPFAVYFPRDSCESSPSMASAVSRSKSGSCSSDSEMSIRSLPLEEIGESDPSMMTVYISLRKVLT